MKRVITLAVCCIPASLAVHAQKTPDEVLKSVWAAQKQLATVTYSVQRIDTFTNGTIWNNTGKAELILAANDKPFGFSFRGKRDDFNLETVYDGRVAYTVDHDKKQYDATTNPDLIPRVKGSPGGQVIFSELVKLDTAGAISSEVMEGPDHYWLKFKYPDNKEYDITGRFKLFKIDKKLMLPVEMFNTLYVLDKKQASHFIIQSIKINEPGKITSIKTDFLNEYKQEERKPRRELLALVGSDIKHFQLTSLDNQPVASEGFKGKIVLLDFWEVWCGPCIASMPKVQKLYDTYGEKGLMVYGILTEGKQMEDARKIVKNKQISFPMLIGNPKVTRDYAVSAIPLYVLINREGKIIYVTEDYTTELEDRIRKETGN